MDDKRVAHLLEQLRERTPEEVTLGVMALAASFTPEMWRALGLLRMERNTWSVGSGESATGVLVSHGKPGSHAIVQSKRAAADALLVGSR